jgi:hypothetical protein
MDYFFKNFDWTKLNHQMKTFFIVTVLLCSLVSSQFIGEKDYVIEGNLTITKDLIVKNSSLSTFFSKINQSLTQNEIEIKNLKSNELTNMKWKKIYVPNFIKTTNFSFQEYLFAFDNNLGLLQFNRSGDSLTHINRFSLSRNSWEVPFISSSAGENISMVTGVFTIPGGAVGIQNAYATFYSSFTTEYITKYYQNTIGVNTPIAIFTPRIKSACVSFGEGGIIHGGTNGSHIFDEFFYFNPQVGFMQINTSSKGPTMVDHSMVVNYPNFYFFGNSHEVNSTENILRFDDSKKEWNTIVPNNPIGKRFGHCAWWFQGRMYIFGGQDFNGNYFNNLVYFDFQSNAFVSLKILGIPPNARSFSSCVFSGETLYIFGGKNANETFRDFYKLKVLF